MRFRCILYNDDTRALSLCRYFVSREKLFRREHIVKYLNIVYVLFILFLHTHREHRMLQAPYDTGATARRKYIDMYFTLTTLHTYKSREECIVFRLCFVRQKEDFFNS